MQNQKPNSKPEGVDEKRREAVLESTALFANYVNVASLDLAKARLDESAPGEVLHMVAALIALSEDTNDYADDCEADGWTLTAEEARQRSKDYERSAAALCEIWGLANADGLGRRTLDADSK